MDFEEDKSLSKSRSDVFREDGEEDEKDESMPKNRINVLKENEEED